MTDTRTDGTDPITSLADAQGNNLQCGGSHHLKKKKIKNKEEEEKKWSYLTLL